MDAKQRMQELNKLIDKYNYSTFVLNEQPFPEEDCQKYIEELEQLKKDNPQLLTKEAPIYTQIPLWFLIVLLVKVIYNFPTIVKAFGHKLYTWLNLTSGFMGYITLVIAPILLLLITWQVYMFMKKDDDKKYMKYLMYFDIVMIILNILIFLILGGTYY